jgi:OmpA-OmpF porin, OOP family
LWQQAEQGVPVLPVEDSHCRVALPALHLKPVKNGRVNIPDFKEEQRMKKHLLKLLTLLLLAAVPPAFAEIRSGAVSITPFVGGFTFDGQSHLETAPTYGIRAGYDFTKNLAAEGVFSYVRTDSTGNAGNIKEVDVFNYHVDGLYHFMPEKRLVPFVAAGFGGMHNDSTLEKEDSFALNWGGGIKYFLSDSLALRGDVRHMLAMASDLTRNHLEYTAGISMLFGAKKPAPAPVVAPPPAPVPPPAPPVPEAQPAPITEEPLAPIPAAEPTPEMTKYCVSLGIEFDIDKAEIRTQYHDEVAKVGDFMKKYPTTTALIEGYTDEVGSDDYNMKLSQRRAESVVKYLEDKFGIDKSRLSAKGYGKTKPIADNATDAGRQKNRRINAIIDCALDIKEIAPPPERLCVSLKVNFDTDSAEIKPGYYDEVNKVGEYMKKYPTTTALIEGHTDNVGGFEYNMRLSQRRAEAVVQYLEKNFGIDKARLAAKGYGYTRRVAYNTTPEGRQKNRRTNAIIDCVIKK